MTTTAHTPGALLRAEIAEQPEAWRTLLAAQRPALEEAAAALRAAAPELLVLVARGSSDHAAMLAQYFAQVRLGVPAMLTTPSVVTSYGTQLAFPRSFALAISQSGASPDLLATVASLQEDGVPVLALTNTEGSPLAERADHLVLLEAGTEASVAATKTYTCSLLASLVAIGLAAGDSWGEWEERAERLAALAEEVIAAGLPEGLVEALLGSRDVMVVGRGFSMASAREGALKLTETNGVGASGWSSADATHGPLGQVGRGTLVLALSAGERTRPAVQELARSAAALGGTVVSVGEPLEGASLHVPLPGCADEEAPLLEVLPFQLLALEGALRRGLDPDRPAGLSKVTQTL